MPRKDDIRFDGRAVDLAHESARGEIVRNVGAFTRGSQLIRLRYMMMMEGLRWPILAALSSFTIILVLLLAVLMREHEVQLVEIHLFANFWDLVDFDPTHVVNLTLPNDSIVPISIGDVPGYPDVALAWTKFLRCILVALGGAVILSADVTVPAVTALATAVASAASTCAAVSVVPAVLAAAIAALAAASATALAI